MKYSTVHKPLEQYSTIQYSSLQFSTVQYNTLLQPTLQYSSLHYISFSCSTRECWLLMQGLGGNSRTLAASARHKNWLPQLSTTLHSIALYCTALHYTALYCTALHCTTLHCTALHCTSWYQFKLENLIINNRLSSHSPPPLVSWIFHFLPAVDATISRDKPSWLVECSVWNVNWQPTALAPAFSQVTSIPKIDGQVFLMEQVTWSDFQGP